MLTDSTTIAVVLKTGQQFSYVWGKLDDATKLRVVQYGLREANTDSYASATKKTIPDDTARLARQRELATARDAAIRDGTWATGSSGRGGGATVAALLSKIAELEKQVAEAKMVVAATPPVETRKGRAA